MFKSFWKTLYIHKRVEYGIHYLKKKTVGLWIHKTKQNNVDRRSARSLFQTLSKFSITWKKKKNKSRKNAQCWTGIITRILHSSVLPVKSERSARSLYASVHTYSITGNSIKFLYSSAFQISAMRSYLGTMLFFFNNSILKISIAGLKLS